MSRDEPITQWIKELREGEPEAANALYEVYFEKLMRLARARMQNLPRRTEDEEDAAISAMNSFFRGASEGRFSELSGRDELWRLLATITVRKTIAQHRRFHAEKRPHAPEEAVLDGEALDGGRFIEQVLGREPNPELVAEFTDELQRRLDQLPDDDYRRVAWLRFEGYTNDEIARELGWYPRKVERRLEIIREYWRD